jgi:hypothetical protein
MHFRHCSYKLSNPPQHILYFSLFFIKQTHWSHKPSVKRKRNGTYVKQLRNEPNRTEGSHETKTPNIQFLENENETKRTDPILIYVKKIKIFKIIHWETKYQIYRHNFFQMGGIIYSFFLSFRFAFLRFFRSLPRCHGTLNNIGPLLLPFAPGSWMCWTFTAESWRELRISTDVTEDRAQIWCWIMVAQLTTNSRGLFHSSLHLEQGDFNGFHVRFLITRGQSSFSVIFPIEITIGYHSFR